MEDKVLKMGATSATGSFHLFIGVALSTLIMAIGTIILGRLMTPEEYGLYSVALIPSYMIILFRDWGVDAAITKYTASHIAENKPENARVLIKAGMLFEAATGITLSLILALLSSFIATTIFNRPVSSPLMAIVSLTIFSGAILNAANASFKGFERMELNSLTLICQAIVKTIVSPILVLIGYSALGAVVGYTLSFIAAAITGLVALYLLVLKNLKTENLEKTNWLDALKEMLRYGVPLSISGIIGGFLVQFYAFLMAIYCTDTLIGNFTVASQFAVILTFFTTPIVTVLFPAFSKINPQKERILLQTVFTSSVKYTAILLVPATMAMMVLSKPMISTLFGEKWVHAPLFLTLYVISNLFAAFGNISLSSLLSGTGETKTLMKLSLLTLILGMPMALILIPSTGIIGLIITNITAGIPSMIVGLYYAWKRYEAKPDIKTSIKIFTASTIAAAATLLNLTIFPASSWVELLAGLTTFLLAYLISAPLIGAVNSSDIKNLKTMFSNLGIISKLLAISLWPMEKLTK